MEQKKLIDLDVNEIGYIDYIDIKGDLKYRLIALGFVKNEKISTMYKNFKGGVISYKIRGTHIALREEEAKKIFIFINNIDK